MKQFTLPEKLKNAWFFCRAGGEVYDSNIVHASQLADEWVRLCWGKWDNVTDEEFAGMNETISDPDQWCETDGKPVCFEQEFEDSKMEFHLIGDSKIVAVLEAAFPRTAEARFADKDCFVGYIADAVNPARLKEGLACISMGHAGVCYDVLTERRYRQAAGLTAR